jgi:hypothetical protein
MDRQRQNSLSWLFLAGMLVLAPAATAHTIKTAEDVAVTFHIDPDHNPKAGEMATAWFAMTRRGGKSISLKDCHCRLGVYLDSSQADLTQTMSTSLKSISIKQHPDLPAADLTFPQAGIYRLEFSGTPKQQGDFKSFRMTYNVTVIPSTVAVQPSPLSSERSANNSNSQNTTQDQRQILTAILSVTGGGAILGAIASIFYRQNRKKQVSQKSEVRSQKSEV